MRRCFEKYRYWMNMPAMIFLGMIFIVAGVGKLLYQSDSFAPFPILESLPFTQALYSVLPYIEIAIGALLIHGVMVKFATTLCAFMVAVFATGTAVLVATGRGTELCGCFGMAGRLTHIEALVVEFLMAVLIVAVTVCHRGRYFNLTPWFLDNGHKPRDEPSSGESEVRRYASLKKGG